MGKGMGVFRLVFVVFCLFAPLVFARSFDLSPSASAILPDNTYVKNADGPEVYVVEAGKLRHLKNEDAYRWYKNECFIRFDRTLSKSELDSIGYGSQVVAPQSYTSCPKSGALVKSICLPNVYLFENGQFKWIEDEYTFNTKGYKWGDIVTISEKFIPEYNAPSECGSLGSSIKIVDSVVDPLPRRDLYDFGFGQAVVMNGMGLFAADDLAITVPVVANRANAVMNFGFHSPLGRVGTLLYNSVPQTILNSTVYGGSDFTQSFANLNKYLEGTGVPFFDSSDLGGLYGPWPDEFADGSRYHWLNINPQSTREKAVGLLKSELAVLQNASGIFLDNVDSSSSLAGYPDGLHKTVAAFVNAMPSRPLVGANLFSAKLHAGSDYQVFSSDLFDVVMLEEYGINDKIDDVVRFHKRFPNTVIIVNAKYSGRDQSLLGALTEEKRIGREAVVAAALVGGLHAIDGGVYGHGNNTVARNDFGYSFFRAGRPISDLQDRGFALKRDYKDMIAIYARSNGDLYVRGRWTDFWTKETYENGLPVVAGKSYLLFRAGLVSGAGDVEGAGEIIEELGQESGGEGNEAAGVPAWGGGNVPVEEPIVWMPNNESYVFGDGSSCTSPRELREGEEQKRALMYPGESAWYQINVTPRKIAFFSVKGLQFGRFGLEVYNDCAGDLSSVVKWQDTGEYRYYQVSPAEGTYFVRVIKEGYDNPPKEFSLVASSAVISGQIELQVVDFFVAGKDMAEDSNVLEVWLRNNGRAFDHMVNVGAFGGAELLGWANVYGMGQGELRRVRLVASSPSGARTVTVGNGAGSYGWQESTRDPDNLNDNRTKDVVFEVPRRDLELGFLRVSGAVPYEPATIEYVVRNRGNLREPFFVSSGQVVGGAGKGEMHYDLYPGAEARVSFSWVSFVEGNFTVAARVDENDVVAEFDEDNNVVSHVVEWRYPRAELPVDSGGAKSGEELEEELKEELEEELEQELRGNGTLVIVNETAKFEVGAELDGGMKGISNESDAGILPQSAPPVIARGGGGGGGGVGSVRSVVAVVQASIPSSPLPPAEGPSVVSEDSVAALSIKSVTEESISSEKPLGAKSAPNDAEAEVRVTSVQSAGVELEGKENSRLRLALAGFAAQVKSTAVNPAIVTVLTVIIGLGVWKLFCFEEFE